MNTITKVIVEQAEGLTEDMVPRTYEGPTCVRDAEKHLRKIAVTAPKSGGYYKTDVTITLVDGTDYQFRFDIKRLGLEDNDLSIVAHAIRCWETFGGIAVPEHYRSQYTSKQWEDLMCSQHGSEAVMEMRRMLDVLTGAKRIPLEKGGVVMYGPSGTGKLRVRG